MRAARCASRRSIVEERLITRRRNRSTSRSCLPGVLAFDRAPDGGIADGVVIEMLKHIEFGLGLAKLLMKPGYLISQREQALLCASHWRIVRVGVGAEASRIILRPSRGGGMAGAADSKIR